MVACFNNPSIRVARPGGSLRLSHQPASRGKLQINIISKENDGIAPEVSSGLHMYMQNMHLYRHTHTHIAPAHNELTLIVSFKGLNTCLMLQGEVPSPCLS